jgi:hypothetical protein
MEDKRNQYRFLFSCLEMKVIDLDTFKERLNSLLSALPEIEQKGVFSGGIMNLEFSQKYGYEDLYKKFAYGQMAVKAQDKNSGESERPQSGNNGKDIRSENYELDGGTRGGIDFRALPMKDLGVNGGMVMPLVDMEVVKSVAQGSNIKNMENEWNDIMRSMQTDKSPAFERLSRFAAVSRAQGNKEYRKKVAVRILELFEMEEYTATPTPKALLDAFVFVSGKTI